MGGRENLALIVAPGDSSNGVAVTLEHPEAVAGLRVPEADIVGARKELSLVRMPGQTLDVVSRASHYLQAAPTPHLPESDSPVPAAGKDSRRARIENGMIDAICVTLESLQQLPARQLP